MKIVSNIARLGVGSLCIVTAIVMMGSQSQALSSTRTTNSEACSHITTLASTSNTKVQERIANMQADFHKRLANISSRQDSIDQKVETLRTTTSDTFDEKVTELKNKPGLTQDQLTAIAVYEKDMKSAEAARVLAVDGTRTTYRTALSGQVANHQSELSISASTFKASIAAAFTTAENDCGNGAALSMLKSSVKTVRAAFQTAHKSDEIKTSIEQLAATRRTSIAAANTEFRSRVTTVTATLASVLGDSK